MRKILILLFLTSASLSRLHGQQISVQGDEIKYRTTNGIKTAVNTDTLTSRLTLKVDKIAGKGLSTNDYTNAAAATLSANAANITLLQADRNSLFDSVSNKLNKVSGKGLSANDYTTTEKTKLAGIATAATANATDASLRDRTTHTGVQAISTVTGLQTALDGKQGKITGVDYDTVLGKLDIVEGDVSIRGFNTPRKIQFTENILGGGLLQGGYFGYDGLNNFIEIGVHPTFDNIVDNDIRVLMISRTNGNIGIGTNIPLHKLHVVGNTATTKLLVNTTTDAGFQADVNGSMRVTGAIYNENFLQSGTVASGVYSTLSGNDLRFFGQGTAYIEQRGIGGVLLFRTSAAAVGDVNAMLINSSGNIGVNILNPLQKLHVNGNIRIENATDGVIMKTPDGTKTFKITINNSGQIITTQQ